MPRHATPWSTFGRRYFASHAAIWIKVETQGIDGGGIRHICRLSEVRHAPRIRKYLIDLESSVAFRRRNGQRPKHDRAPVNLVAPWFENGDDENGGPGDALTHFIG